MGTMSFESTYPTDCVNFYFGEPFLHHRNSHLCPNVTSFEHDKKVIIFVKWKSRKIMEISRLLFKNDSKKYWSFIMYIRWTGEPQSANNRNFDHFFLLARCCGADFISFHFFLVCWSCRDNRAAKERRKKNVWKRKFSLSVNLFEKKKK